jgi:DNA-binding Lrp family transcriptional regulator
MDGVERSHRPSPPRLRESGVIIGFHAEVDPAALGRSLRLLVDVSLRDDVVAAAANPLRATLGHRVQIALPLHEAFGVSGAG